MAKKWDFWTSTKAVNMCGNENKAKVKPKNKLDGLSLKKLILEKNITWDDRYIYNYWRGRLSLRSQDYRLDDNNNLYDMNLDPNQLKDISLNKKEVFDSMKTSKIKWKNILVKKIPLSLLVVEVVIL